MRFLTIKPLTNQELSLPAEESFASEYLYEYPRFLSFLGTVESNILSEGHRIITGFDVGGLMLKACMCRLLLKTVSLRDDTLPLLAH